MIFRIVGSVAGTIGVFELPRSPSALGVAVESALESHFARHREPVQYLAAFRSSSGTVFAIERVTLTQIMLWLPDQESVRRAADRAGIAAMLSVPWPAGRSGKYGRISSLKAIPELVDAQLLKVAVTTAGDAMSLAESIV